MCITGLCHTCLLYTSGTDHGYLPIYLVQEGIARSAIAMDLRKGPLDKAKKHICDNCLEDVYKRQVFEK